LTHCHITKYFPFFSPNAMDAPGDGTTVPPAPAPPSALPVVTPNKNSLEAPTSPAWLPIFMARISAFSNQFIWPIYCFTDMEYLTTSPEQHGAHDVYVCW
jgi:hypothetical protein